MKQLSLKKIDRLIILPVLVGLIFTMTINGWYFLTGDGPVILKYLNVYNNSQVELYPAYFGFLFGFSGIFQLIAAIVLVLGIIRENIFGYCSASVLKWGIFSAMLSVLIFGYMTRITSNHNGAANLYFYLVLLYLLLWYVERNIQVKRWGIFEKIRLLPVYISVFYTMGFPGWQKIVNTSEVMEKYVNMFSATFLSKLPGGVPPFIYFLGCMEIAVPLLLLLSAVRKEFLYTKNSLLLNIALFLTICTFVMLSFGLSILVNYPGSTNLILFALFTLGLYCYVRSTGNREEV